MNEVFHRISNTGVVPVAVIEDAEKTEQLLAALSDGGLRCIEITMRTKCAARAIEIACGTHPEMLVGAGTVLNTENAVAAVAAGAKFIVSPGFDLSVAAFCAEREIPFFPGVVTPTEITAALAAGIDRLKFFPAETFGGAATLKALSSPFGEVKFMPTGGITSENFKSYLKLPCVFACGGSFMVSSALVKNGEFNKIRDITRKCVEDMLGFESCEGYSKAQKTHGLPELTFSGIIGRKEDPSVCNGEMFEIKTDFIERAIFFLAENGVQSLSGSKEYDTEGRLISAVLKDKFFGANIKLIKKIEG